MRTTYRHGLNNVRAVRAALTVIKADTEDVEFLLAGEDGLWDASFVAEGSPTILPPVRKDLTMSGRPYTWDEDSDR